MDNLTDRELLARFEATDATARQHFLDLHSSWRRVPAEQRVTWQRGEEIGPNVWRMGYPVYSHEFEAMRNELYAVNAVAEHAWMDEPLWGRVDYNDPSVVAELSLPDLFKLNFMVARAERFSEGTLARFVETGTFDAVLARIAQAL